MTHVDRTTLGFVIVEGTEDYEQILGLETGDGLPERGILSWPGDTVRMAVFEQRRDARAAITRTKHYAAAFGVDDRPDPKFCTIRPIERVRAVTHEEEGS